jgi:hypothetical protein
MVSFTLFVSKATTGKLLCKVQPAFTIGLDPKDLILLQEIPKFFGEVGKIHTRKDVSGVQYVISSVKDLTNHIIPHFDTYPLCSQKKADQPSEGAQYLPITTCGGDGLLRRAVQHAATLTFLAKHAQDMNYLKK